MVRNFNYVHTHIEWRSHRPPVFLYIQESVLTTSTFMSCSAKCSYHFSWKSVKWLKHLNGATRRRAYTEMMITKFFLYIYIYIYTYSFYFCFFKREGWFKAHSRPHSKCPPFHHEHQLVYSVFQTLRMLHLVAHAVLTCAEQQMTLHNLYSVQGWNKQKKSSPSVALSFMFETSLMTKFHHFETMWWLDRRTHGVM